MKDQKDQSRAEILAAASRRFRADGISATGIAGIMQEAHKTNGAFYGHFGSKEDLVCEVLKDALQRQAEDLSASASEGTLRTALANYLSVAHRDHPGEGCPSAALLPEISRQPLATRQAYEENLKSILKSLSVGLGGGQHQMRKAMAIFSMAIGALQLARAVPSAEYAEILLKSALDEAEMMLKDQA
ncbi:TetR/AcrR family transcriptional regulator [Rhizobium sp. Rhizsp82]|uniref:TetR/AcrR family transcriptional regulator n=1 Tax=Rhizobium sp. Rhizsp82 TaxID=3243057 RepID=UPI0039B63741